MLERAPTDTSSVAGIPTPATGARNGVAVLYSRPRVTDATGGVCTSRTDYYKPTTRNKRGGVSRGRITFLVNCSRPRGLRASFELSLARHCRDYSPTMMSVVLSRRKHVRRCSDFRGQQPQREYDYHINGHDTGLEAHWNRSRWQPMHSRIVLPSQHPRSLYS